MVSWFARIAFCLFSLYKPVVCNVSLNEDALPQSNLESTEGHVSAKPRDGVQYYLSIASQRHHRVASHGPTMFTYNGGYGMDQLWELEEDKELKGCFFITNVKYTNCRFSSSNSKGTSRGGRSDRDLVKFQRTGNYYFIVSYSTGARFTEHKHTVTIYDDKLMPGFNNLLNQYLSKNQKFFLTPRFGVTAFQKDIWMHDNRGGSKPFKSPAYEEKVGVSVTGKSSFETGLSVTTTVEVGVEVALGDIGLGASASTSMTSYMKRTMSSEQTNTWTKKVTRGPYTAPAGKYFRIITYDVGGDGKLNGESFTFNPEMTCTIECSGYGDNCPPQNHKCNFGSDTDESVYNGSNQTAEEDKINKIL